MTKRTCSLLFLWFVLFSIGMNAGKKDGRTIYNMNTGWAFYRGDFSHGERPDIDDSRWMPATIPHTMQLEKKHCGGGSIYEGIGWYRRYFRLPEGCENKKIKVTFEGVMTSCEVYCNGEEVAVHHGGYTGFVADITDKVRHNGGNNVLAVRVSAEYDPLTPPGKPQNRMDFYYYSGIYRDVNLVITDKIYITDELEENVKAGGGVFVTYPSVNKEMATVNVSTHIRNDYRDDRLIYLRTTLKDAKGKIVAWAKSPLRITGKSAETVRQSLMVANPLLWHPYHPDLYTLESKVEYEGKAMDVRREEIGIRSIQFTTDEGFFINGEPLYIVGGNRHQAYPYVGDAASNSMQEREVIDMKRGGFNAVRAAHYPHDPAFLSACDRYGLLVVECIPGWQYFNASPLFSDRLEQVGRQMIRRDRNHPSIILWETALNETSYPLNVVKRIYEAAHEEYPGKQCYTAGDYLSHEQTEPYYDVFYKQVSRYPKDGNVMSNFPEDQAAIKPLLTREWGDGAGEKPRVSLEENEYEQMRQCRSRYVQLNGDGYFDWCMLDANPRMAGHFLWSYNDYNRGAEDETMYSGVVDVNRAPKFGYYMMQSMRHHDISQPGLYEGPMVFIASRNASSGYPSSTSEIMVFSNSDSVRLYRNDKLIGTQTRETAARRYPHIVKKGGSPSFIFDAGGYESGELRAEAYVDGKVVAVHRVHTPGKAAKIKIEIPEYPVRPEADGSDMIPVYMKVCDVEGNLVDASSAKVSLKVSGEGSLIGDGIARIGVNPQYVEGGIGFAFVRTTQKAGKIHIHAESEGLESDEAVIRTYPSGKRLLADGDHKVFGGHEEDGVVVKPARRESEILSRPKAEIAHVEVTSQQTGYGKEHLTDNDDFSWWIAGDNSFPQVITLTLKELTRIKASRIRFQKDSSSYTHHVEVSSDGVTWTPFYNRECTGWEFKPVPLDKEIKYFRLTIDKCSEGRAGAAQITLYR